LQEAERAKVVAKLGGGQVAALGWQTAQSLLLNLLAHAAEMSFICGCLQEAELAKVVAKLGGWQVAAEATKC
jgi:hypothetical protein